MPNPEMTDLHALLACVVAETDIKTASVHDDELKEMKESGQLDIELTNNGWYVITVSPPHKHDYQTYTTDDQTFELHACTGCGHIARDA